VPSTASQLLCRSSVAEAVLFLWPSASIMFAYLILLNSGTQTNVLYRYHFYRVLPDETNSFDRTGMITFNYYRTETNSFDSRTT
jgi:hypothetical protein